MSTVNSPCWTGWGELTTWWRAPRGLGMGSLAISDHGTMFGVIDFYRACKAP